MTNDDQNSGPSPPEAELIPASSRGAIAPAIDPIWALSNPPPTETSALVGGMEFTPGRLLRALRRRWLMALLLAVAGALAAGYVASQLVGSTYTARTQVYIPADRPGNPFGPQSGGDVAAFQRRQSALVKSRHVLQVALQRPEAASLSTIRNTPEAVAWLEKDLLVDFSTSPDLMRISLKGNPPDDLVALLNAVREAYLQEAANRELNDKTASLRWYRQMIEDDRGKLATLQAEVAKKARAMNAADAVTLRYRCQNDAIIVAQMRAMRFQYDMSAKDLQQAYDDLVASASQPQPVEVTAAKLRAATEAVFAQDDEAESLRILVRQLTGEIVAYKRLIKPGTTTKELDDKEAERKEAEESLKSRKQVLGTEAARLVEEEERRGSEASAKANHARIAELKSQVGRACAQLQAFDDEILKRDTAAQGDLKGLAELEGLTTRINELEAKIRVNEVKADSIEADLAIANPFRAETHEKAEIVQVPNPAKKTWVVTGAIALGLFAGLLAVAYLDLRSGRIDSPEGVDRRLHTGVVGCIPRVRPSALARLAQPTGDDTNDADQALLLDATDACRTLLLNALAGGGSKVIMVTSAMPGEGKTSLATQLALSLGRGGCRTLLIDADVRHPGVHNIFGRSQSPGLSDVLRKTYPLQYVIRKSSEPNVGLLPAGQCNPQEAVALFQLRMSSLLRKCKPHFDVILIDTPPLLGLPDAMVIGRYADGTILSLMNDVSTLPAAQAACDRLRTLNIPLLGAVLNAARVKAPLGYY